MSDICRRLSLSSEQCEILDEYIQSRYGRETKTTTRKRSRWQECIASRRKGQRFDPQAIKELAREYKEGRCP